MAENREFDLILFGATGFVGRLTAKYLAGGAPESARIALAGRSLQKLTKVRDDLGHAAAGWGLVVADVADQTALDALAARTTAVVTTVGPYQRYGMPLVAACAKSGTHYADLTGESVFTRDAIDRFHDQAVTTSAKIVNSCGFDSIPSDLCVYQLYRSTVADHSGELEDTTLIATVQGGVSGGTIDSARAMLEVIAADPSKQSVISDPYSLSPDKSMDPNVGRQSDRALQRAKTIAPHLEGWVGTFVMAPHNTKIVRRSNGLLGWVYGKNFRYREVMDAGKTYAAPMIAAAVSGGIVAGMAAGAVLSRSSGGRRLLDRVLPKPGTGPNEESLAQGWFTMNTYARTSSGAEYVATFSGAGDPGYQATAVMLGESGLCLAFDGAKLPQRAGIITPATAMGDLLTDRLRATGMTIEVERSRS
ncbi:saccharopine dehydrogenase NADP-binding domain-containing protein [Nocardia sp. NBC_00508]|uniref:saccharopine dehydrogenase family protein n=1 Tax=Nocardia sp. NBC_00508 TaxID=2975992 RepID=UPI002E813CD8|nr:saccharopine dehydrogenase NADP-binding domain-containing protein [Nocardia sp. NBC_00508]WUD67068.1 saccharopine dehydrogenase NADP-binding domain-containing protein [Nocardia sp. NBC_00508]